MLLRNLSFYGLSRVIVIGAQFLFVPISVAQLGAAGYGTYGLILQCALLIRLISLQGVAQSIIRNYKHYEEKYDAAIIYKASTIFSSLFFLITIFIVFTFSKKLSNLLNLPHRYFYYVFLMGAVSLWLGLKHTILYCKNIYYYTVWDLVITLSLILSQLVFFRIFNSIESYFVAFIIASLAIILLMPSNENKISQTKSAVAEFGTNIRQYGAYLMFGELLGWITAVADRFQIASILNSEQTGIYAAAYQLFVAPMTMLGFAVALVIQPIAFASNNKSFQKKMEQAATLLTVVSVICIVVALLIGDEVFLIFFRHQATIDRQLIFLLAITGIANSFFQLELIASKFSQKTNLILVTQFFVTIAMLIGNWILLPSVGIKGAALTSACSYIIITNILKFFSSNEVKFSYFNSDLIKEYLFPIINKNLSK